VAKQIEEYGRQPAGIEVRLGIELGLDEDERQIRPPWRGQQDAVEAKGGLLDLLGMEPVIGPLGHRQARQLEDRRRALLEDAVERGIGVHRYSGFPPDISQPPRRPAR
jgi:hypothetical protein